MPGVAVHSDPKPDTVNSDNNNITLHVHVKHLGKENQDHLTSLTYKELKKLLKLTPDHETLMAMICFVHLHEQHPENRNVRLTGEDDVAEVKRKGRWVKRRRRRILQASASQQGRSLVPIMAIMFRSL